MIFLIEVYLLGNSLKGDWPSFPFKPSYLYTNWSKQRQGSCCSTFCTSHYSGSPQSHNRVQVPTQMVLNSTRSSCDFYHLHWHILTIWCSAGLLANNAFLSHQINTSYQPLASQHYFSHNKSAPATSHSQQNRAATAIHGSMGLSMVHMLLHLGEILCPFTPFLLSTHRR